LSGDRHVAVSHNRHQRGFVSVFSVDGEFIRRVGDPSRVRASSVACSACDELVVTDATHRNRRIVVFSASGETMRTLRSGDFVGVAVHGSTVFAFGHLPSTRREQRSVLLLQ
jgi:hypothetical protein